MVGAFSESDSNQSSDSSDAPSTTTVTKDLQSSSTTSLEVTLSSVNSIKAEAKDDELTTDTRLVLVGNGEKASQVAVQNQQNGAFATRGKNLDTNFGELQLTLNDLADQVKALPNGNHFDEIQKALVSLSGQVQSMNQQFRDIQLLLLRNALMSASVGVPTPHNAPPRTGSGASLAQIKKEVESPPPDDFLDAPFQTPKKIPEDALMRLDVTPTSSADLKYQALTRRNEDPISISNILSSKRSLVFPKSLGDILDGCSDKTDSRIGKDVSIQTEVPLRHTQSQKYFNGPTVTSEPGSPPLMPKVGVKPIREFDCSPRTDAANNLGLLVLADAALKRNPAEELFQRSSEPSESLPTAESDSGRSTEDLSSNGSPILTEFTQRNNYSLIEKFNKYPSSKEDQLPRKSPTKGRRESRSKAEISKTSGSESSSSSDSCERKSRKRRKSKQPLPCSFCGKSFNNQSSLRQHEAFHRPVRPFRCEHEKCEKAYKTRSELNRHLVVHSGDKKHFCKLCGKKFLRKQYLKTHLLRHHETGITMVTPTVGSPQMVYPGSLHSVPVAVVSSAFVSKTEPLTWRCQMCLKIFVNNEDLQKHIRSYHEKKRPVAFAFKDEEESR